MKKCLALLIVCILSVTLVAGCGQNTVAAPVSRSPAQISPATEMASPRPSLTPSPSPTESPKTPEEKLAEKIKARLVEESQSNHEGPLYSALGCSDGFRGNKIAVHLVDFRDTGDYLIMWITAYDKDEIPFATSIKIPVFLFSHTVKDVYVNIYKSDREGIRPTIINSKEEYTAELSKLKDQAFVVYLITAKATSEDKKIAGDNPLLLRGLDDFAAQIPCAKALFGMVKINETNDSLKTDEKTKVTLTVIRASDSSEEIVKKISGLDLSKTPITDLLLYGA